MTTGSRKYSRIKEIFNSIDGVNLHDKKGGTFYYSMATNKQMRDQEIEVLDLSVRSFNCLKRAGIGTIGDIIEYIESGRDLKHIRNCGLTSVAEIKEKMFIWYFMTMPIEKRAQFILETIEKNRAYISNVL